MTRLRNCKWNDRRGMSLVELMVALLIFGIVMGVVFSVMVNSRNSYEATRQKAQLQQSVRAVFSLMTREIRSAGCDPIQLGIEPLPVADATVMQCSSDLNGDADTADLSPDESVVYTFNAGTGELFRDNGSGPVAILRGLQAAAFSYFDDTGNELLNVPLGALDRALVREVGVTVSGQTNDGDTVTYATRISLRNG
ncbi:prepilin-type N-terminal cleavage/methylation domain-containing protein [bacterium]|nr:prepilin-type N-terminal cleavage/methylation domain-containing protein [bacterium]PJA75849.1 MAG: hypothetical protein CO151_04800 [bacterium CG_4_9_14_3_um_filter_65_15]